ncbi:MAG TPA: cupin domain-containing protein [Myxococcaceae bacterium]|nr:cupin domain-containing protein [Myxococcaceae bacterium]
MRNTLGWMLLLSGTLLAGTAQATDAKGFKGVTLASGSFEDLNLWNHWFLSPPTGRADHRMHNLWYSHLRTHGTSDLYVQDNTWDPGGSTGWHTHPGASLIIVTQGTVTAYEGDDPACTPHVYTAGDTFVDSGGGHVHLIRNETAAAAKTIAVQLVPHGPMRRIDAAAPGNCPF